MQYQLTLVEEKVKPHQVTTLHLVSSLAFICAGAIIAIYNYTIPGWGFALLATGLTLIALTIFRNSWMTDKQRNIIFRCVELFVAAAMAAYSAYMQWKFPIIIFGGLSAALLFALYWERRGANLLFIEVDDTGLRLPVLRRRFIPWAEVEVVVLRFGTITINCLDNHFFQWNIVDPDFDKNRFEAFCKDQIEQNIVNRRNDNW